MATFDDLPAELLTHIARQCAGPRERAALAATCRRARAARHASCEAIRILPGERWKSYADLWPLRSFESVRKLALPRCGLAFPANWLSNMVLPNLEELDISHNLLHDEAVDDFVCHHGRLRQLNAGGNRIRDPGARRLAAMPSLRCVTLNDNRIGVGGCVALAEAQHITTVRVSVCGCDADLESLFRASSAVRRGRGVVVSVFFQDNEGVQLVCAPRILLMCGGRGSLRREPAMERLLANAVAEGYAVHFDAFYQKFDADTLAMYRAASGHAVFAGSVLVDLDGEAWQRMPTLGADLRALLADIRRDEESAIEQASDRELHLQFTFDREIHFDLETFTAATDAIAQKLAVEGLVGHDVNTLVVCDGAELVIDE